MSSIIVKAQFFKVTLQSAQQERNTAHVLMSLLISV